MANKKISNNSSISINEYALIVAHDEVLGIGKNNSLPWHIPEDMKHFRSITCQKEHKEINETQNVVIMGRKTWESLPQAFKPLPKRINMVLTKNSKLLLPSDVLISESLEKAIQIIGGIPHAKVFVIGGAAIYKEAIKMDIFTTLYVTEIEGQYNCDVFFPEYRNSFRLIESSKTMADGNYRYGHKTYLKNTLVAK